MNASSASIPSTGGRRSEMGLRKAGTACNKSFCWAWIYVVFILPLLLRNGQNMRHGTQSTHPADHAGPSAAPTMIRLLNDMLLTSIKSFPTIDRFFMSKPDDWIPLMTASAVVETLKRSFRPIQPLSGLPACFGGANLIRAPKLKEKRL